MSQRNVLSLNTPSNGWTDEKACTNMIVINGSVAQHEDNTEEHDQVALVASKDYNYNNNDNKGDEDNMSYSTPILKNANDPSSTMDENDHTEENESLADSVTASAGDHDDVARMIASKHEPFHVEGGSAVEVTPASSSTFENETNCGESSQKCANVEGAAEKVTTPQVSNETDDCVKSPAGFAHKVPGLEIKSGETEMQQQQQEEQCIPNNDDNPCTNLSNDKNDYPLDDAINDESNNSTINKDNKRRSMLKKSKSRARRSSKRSFSGSSCNSHETKQPSDEKLYTQALVMGLAILAVWSPQNLMAPNLTQMATFFDYSPKERDTYLGANIAFATGVLSLPIAGFIGAIADLVPSRKNLYSLVVFMGGIGSLLTANSKVYSHLYFARFATGGCMAGATPIAFSMLGDFFNSKDRNAASSALTSCMGLGILMGQVYSGYAGDKFGWQYPFYVSALLCFTTSILVCFFVKEPVRGGKEKVLQEMIKRGKKYDRKLTPERFLNSIRTNGSNRMIMWASFFGNVPWGIIFVFLNDYLSQEKGLSVPQATFLVLVFGVGTGFGGLFGGYLGKISNFSRVITLPDDLFRCCRIKRASYTLLPSVESEESSSCCKIRLNFMPLMMAAATILGILPMCGVLVVPYKRAHSFVPISLSFLAGVIPNLPSVNVRPALINVNPPEMRGAALTAANLMVNLARGIGPLLLTSMCHFFSVTRETGMNCLLVIFWVITAGQFIMLAHTLPVDQESMDAELKIYADSMFEKKQQSKRDLFQKSHKRTHSGTSDRNLTIFLNDPSSTGATNGSIRSVESIATSNSSSLSKKPCFVSPKETTPLLSASAVHLASSTSAVNAESVKIIPDRDDSILFSPNLISLDNDEGTGSSTSYSTSTCETSSDCMSSSSGDEISIEDRMLSFDAVAAQESFEFITEAIREMTGQHTPTMAYHPGVVVGNTKKKGRKMVKRSKSYGEKASPNHPTFKISQTDLGQERKLDEFIDSGGRSLSSQFSSSKIKKPDSCKRSISYGDQTQHTASNLVHIREGDEEGGDSNSVIDVSVQNVDVAINQNDSKGAVNGISNNVDFL